MKTTGICVVLLVFLLCFTPAVSGQQQGTASEAEIKTAFIYNFIKFVEWPTSVLPAAEQRMIVCVLGQDDIVRTLKRISGKVARGRTITVKHVADLKEITQCHVVYVGQSEKDYTGAIIGAAPKHVLTISDVPSFAASGGMINFFMKENKISFEINVDTAEQAGLKLSSQLLRLARVVKDSK